jgi:hypothetical protein
MTILAYRPIVNPDISYAANRYTVFTPTRLSDTILTLELNFTRPLSAVELDSCAGGDGAQVQGVWTSLRAS